jgi:seryl-tRNA synthetase
MIDLQLLRTEEGFQRVLVSLARRGDATGADNLKAAAEKRRAVIKETEALSAERNTQSKKAR